MAVLHSDRIFAGERLLDGDFNCGKADSSGNVEDHFILLNFFEVISTSSSSK